MEHGLLVFLNVLVSLLVFFFFDIIVVSVLQILFRHCIFALYTIKSNYFVK